MKSLLFAILLMSAGAVSAAPAPVEKPAEKSAAAVAKDGTSREHSFEDLLVQGKYQFSDEAVTTVEGDKVLDSLLGIRTDFKDRIEKAAGRN